MRTLASWATAIGLASALSAVAPVAAADSERGRERDRDESSRPTIINAIVGAETTNEAIQALAFLPNDVSAKVGDTIEWGFPTHEPHTLSFLQPGQSRPGAATAPVTPSGSTFDGTLFLNSGTLLDGQSYTMKLGAAGDFPFVCLIHGKMSGTLHVGAADGMRTDDRGAVLRLGRDEGRDLLREGLRLEQTELGQVIRDADEVTIGSGFVRTSPAGAQSVMIARFLPTTRHARVGDTLQWTANDPATPHTVTFGTAPGNPSAVVNATNGSAVLPTTPSGLTVSSGFLGATFPRQQFSVTFNAPGTYAYYCALHVDLGMRGTIVVN